MTKCREKTKLNDWLKIQRARMLHPRIEGVVIPGMVEFTDPKALHSPLANPKTSEILQNPKTQNTKHNNHTLLTNAQFTLLTITKLHSHCVDEIELHSLSTQVTSDCLRIRPIGQFVRTEVTFNESQKRRPNTRFMASSLDRCRELQNPETICSN